MKTAAVLIPGGGAFALFLCPHCGAFGSLSAPTPGNLPSKKKNANARGGGGMSPAGIDRCIIPVFVSEYPKSKLG